MVAMTPAHRRASRRLDVDVGGDADPLLPAASDVPPSIGGSLDLGRDDDDSIWITQEDGGFKAVALRAAIVAFTALVALVAPSVTDLIEVIGALLAPWLALTIPALLDLCAGLSMKAYPMTPVDICVASFVLSTSFILAICGTTAVILEL